MSDIEHEPVVYVGDQIIPQLLWERARMFPELVAALELALAALMALHPDAAGDMTDARLAVLYNSSLEKTAAALAKAKEQV